jgi:hypothetical protein
VQNNCSDRIAPDLVMAEITNAAWKFVLFDGVEAESAQAAVRDEACNRALMRWRLRLPPLVTELGLARPRS